VPEIAEDIPGVDLERLLAWMDASGLGAGPFTEVTALTGGSQNILVRLRRDGRTYVLRRGPVHKRANTDETMRRETRVLAALAGSGVPHPALIAACPGEGVLGGAFYLMEPVDGFAPALTWPHPPHSDHPELQHEMGLEMARAIGRLGAVDHVAAGLGDFGKPDGWLERQVPRWLKHLEGYRQVPGYPPDSLPHVPEIAAWLEAHRPPTWTPGIIHGDFHFSNVLFEPSSPKLAAMVDWELATIGDPLLDLGHLLSTWPTHFLTFSRFEAPGLPTRDEVIAEYASVSGRPVEAADWYEVLAAFRLAIIIEGTLVRAIEGKTSEANGQRLHTNAVGLLDRASTLI
jgi:aminoglycoside phosphotransferase (APT) family kinase protein